MTDTQNNQAGERTQWHYSGDVNLEYGGLFLNLDNWEHGYADAVRVTDLDSGCGFDGAVLIERIAVIVDEKYFAESAACCGFDPADINLETDGGKLQMLDALVAYGHYDPANEYYQPINEVVQTQEDGPMSFDGWKATKRVLSENLEGYVQSEYLS